MVDIWRSDEHGALLFWVDGEVDLWGFGHAKLGGPAGLALAIASRRCP